MHPQDMSRQWYLRLILCLALSLHEATGCHDPPNPPALEYRSSSSAALPSNSASKWKVQPRGKVLDAIHCGFAVVRVTNSRPAFHVVQ